MQETKMKLDELELCIQLVQHQNPDLKYARYQDLADVIEFEFKQKVDIQDVFLLHEPRIEDDLVDYEIYYGSMFNMSGQFMQ